MKKKLVVLAALAAVGIVVPAEAKKPPPPKPPNCTTARHEGFRATGTLENATPPLFQTSKGSLYSGSITVNVRKANHHQPTGPGQHYTATNARVKFHGVKPADQMGSRIDVSGKMDVAPKGCAPVPANIVITKIDLHKAPKPKPPAPPNHKK